MHVLSFITAQTGRGLQIESPVSTLWMWQGRLPRATDRRLLRPRDPHLPGHRPGDRGCEFAHEPAPRRCGHRGRADRHPRRATGGAGTRASSRSCRSRSSARSSRSTRSARRSTWAGWRRRSSSGSSTRGAGSARRRSWWPSTAGAHPGLLSVPLRLADRTPSPAMVGVLTIRNLMYFVILGWAVAALWRRVASRRSGRRPAAGAVWPFRAEPAAHPDPAGGEAGRGSRRRNHAGRILCGSERGRGRGRVRPRRRRGGRPRRARVGPARITPTPCSPTIEGEWDEVFDVVRRATDAVGRVRNARLPGAEGRHPAGLLG